MSNRANTQGQAVADSGYSKRIALSEADAAAVRQAHANVQLKIKAMGDALAAAFDTATTITTHPITLGSAPGFVTFDPHREHTVTADQARRNGDLLRQVNEGTSPPTFARGGVVGGRRKPEVLVVTANAWEIRAIAAEVQAAVEQQAVVNVQFRTVRGVLNGGDRGRSYEAVCISPDVAANVELAERVYEETDPCLAVAILNRPAAERARRLVQAVIDAHLGA